MQMNILFFGFALFAILRRHRFNELARKYRWPAAMIALIDGGVDFAKTGPSIWLSYYRQKAMTTLDRRGRPSDLDGRDNSSLIAAAIASSNARW